MSVDRSQTVIDIDILIIISISYLSTYIICISFISIYHIYLYLCTNVPRRCLRTGAGPWRSVWTSSPPAPWSVSSAAAASSSWRVSIQYSAVQYSTVQYSTAQYSTIQYGKVCLICCCVLAPKYPPHHTQSRGLFITDVHSLYLPWLTIVTWRAVVWWLFMSCLSKK